MKNYFFIKEAAEKAGITAEALRHYDRIGLVKPSRRDDDTGYRLYSNRDILRLKTVHILRCMGLSLSEIKQALELDDLEKTVSLFRKAEQNADEKISEMMKSKEKISRIRGDYEVKLARKGDGETVEKYFPERVLLLSEEIEEPSLEVLWGYLGNFYGKIPPDIRCDFCFEDTAGVYIRDGISRMYAVCIKYRGDENIIKLPAGKYLCAECSEHDFGETLNGILSKAYKNGNPPFVLKQIIVSGILKWDYLIQIPVSPGSA